MQPTKTNLGEKSAEYMNENNNIQQMNNQWLAITSRNMRNQRT